MNKVYPSAAAALEGIVQDDCIEIRSIVQQLGNRIHPLFSYGDRNFGKLQMKQHRFIPDFQGCRFFIGQGISPGLSFITPA